MIPKQFEVRARKVLPHKIEDGRNQHLCLETPSLKVIRIFLKMGHKNNKVKSTELEMIGISIKNGSADVMSYWLVVFS